MTNIQNGDKSAGGAVDISNDVNMGTGIYKLNLMNLAPEHFAMQTPVKSTPEVNTNDMSLGAYYVLSKMMSDY